ncbi:MAG: site-2 protease family protein [Acidimicrobiia bacterium]|nr:site-2 protease family protein [Acidimicrobiia bacterium]
MPSIPAGRLLGVPLRIGVSWLVIIPIVGIALFAGIPIATGSTGGRIAVAAGGTLLLFVSVIVHEVGHLVAARRRDVPVGGIRVFLLGGYSDLALDSVTPRTEIVVAAAGPITSAILALVVGGVGLLIPDVGGLHRTAGVVVLVNVAIAMGNLLPGLPLDGGRVVRGMLRSAGWSIRRAERGATWLGLAMGVLLTIAGFVLAVMGRAASMVVAPAGMVLILLATGTRPLAAKRAADVMRPAGEALGETDPVSGLDPAGFPVPVVRGTKVVGLVLAPGAGLAGELMVPVTPGDLVDADCDLEELARRLADGSRPLLVVERGRLVGILEMADLQRVAGIA